ncbi:ABC transporter substrate-binding protein [Ensifer sp. NBAIM29]|nr:ABC transporter substrate-binding protein [Ensifer sp. NBAIM29]
MSMRHWAQLAPLTAAFAIGIASSSFAQDTIKYGLVTAFSGPAASWGKMMETSAELAVEDINAAGGIKVGDKSYQLKLYKYDHAYDPTKAVTVVRQAIQQDGIKMMDVLGGGIIPAIQPITEPAKVLVFGTAAGETWVGEKKPYTFKPYFNSAEAATAILLAAKQKNPNVKTALLMYPDDDLGHSTAEALAKNISKADVELLDPIFTARDVTDFYPIALKVMQNPPDIIDFGPTPGSQNAQMIKQLNENGYQGLFAFSDLYDQDALVQAGVLDISVGGLTAPNWDVVEQTERGKNWSDRYKQRYGSLQAWTSQEYDSYWLLKAAIEKAGTFDDTDKIAAALEEVKAQGLAGGEVRYGGKETIGLARAYVMDYPVAEVKKAGDSVALEQVYVYKP